MFMALLFSCQQNITASTEDVEERLKAIVEVETYAYMEKDYHRWVSYWDHSNDVLRLDVSTIGFAQVRGWDRSGGILESFLRES